MGVKMMRSSLVPQSGSGFIVLITLGVFAIITVFAGNPNPMMYGMVVVGMYLVYVGYRRGTNRLIYGKNRSPRDRH